MLDDFHNQGSYKIFELAGDEGIDELKTSPSRKKRPETRKRSVIEFSHRQKSWYQPFNHYDRNIALQELLHESVYAGPAGYRQPRNLTIMKKAPTRFIRTYLAKSNALYY